VCSDSSSRREFSQENFDLAKIKHCIQVVSKLGISSNTRFKLAFYYLKFPWEFEPSKGTSYPSVEDCYELGKKSGMTIEMNRHSPYNKAPIL